MSRRKADRIRGRREHGGVLTVPCQLNGNYRYWFLADTGAALTVISEQAAREMNLDLGQPAQMLEIVSVHQLAHAPRVRLNTLQIGGHKVNNIDVLVLSLPRNLRVDGLLGINFLQHFRPTFEFEQATLVLR